MKSKFCFAWGFFVVWFFVGLVFCCLFFVCLFGVFGVVFWVHLKKLFVLLSLVFSRARVSGIEGFKADSIGLRG